MIVDRSIVVDGVTTTYSESGTGHPIVFLHGAGFAAEGKNSFIRQLNGLSDQYRTLAVDQLHFGGTDYPADGKYINRIGRVNHVIGFLDAMRLQQVTLVGHSEGSFVAARIAIVRPDLVSRLVLLTSSGVSPAFGDDRDEGWVQACRKRYDYSGQMPTEEEFIAARRRNSRAYGEDLEVPLREAYRRAAARGQYKIFQNLPEEEENPRIYALLQQKFVIPYLEKIEIPTMIIWSKNDDTVPVERGIMLAKLIKPSSFHLLNNAGHSIQIDQSVVVNDLIRRWY